MLARGSKAGVAIVVNTFLFATVICCASWSGAIPIGTFTHDLLQMSVVSKMEKAGERARQRWDGKGC